MDAERLQVLDAGRLAFEAVTSAFASLGRVCLALDEHFYVRHVSPRLDHLLGEGACARCQGRGAEELLGQELFGPEGTLRLALGAGERREGWRAWLRAEPTGSRLVSVSAAPLVHLTTACDPEATYLVVLRPAEEDEATRGAAPTVFSGVIARSRSMLRVLKLVEGLQHSDVTVLLTGESGVGKGVVAQAIHANSLRRSGPFVAVNCAALPETLLESELFGHVRGAFTGATRDRTGRFELASHGTLFLDEIGDLPLHLQAKLLRVIQDRTFERVGDSRSLAADVRIVAATHRDLRRAVEGGQFRQDLYYRLRVFPIDLPPLRDRREDIEPLARRLLARAEGRTGRALRFSPEALRTLLAYPWPGNVRELENSLEYAATVAQGQTLQPEDLPPEVTAGAARAEERGAASPPRPSFAVPETGGRALVSVSPAAARRAESPDRETVVAALNAYHWRIADASRALGISRTTLWRWMRELGVSR